MPSIIKVDQIQSDQGFVNVSSNLQFSSGFTMLTPTLSSPTLTTPTTSGVLTLGAGIKFPATQSASADANTLDDYEEGTWTPAVSGRTFSTVFGNYTKIGNMVHIVGTLNGISSSVTNPEITGLPFPISNAANLEYGGYIPGFEVAGWTLTAGYYYLYFRCVKATSYLQALQGNGSQHTSGVVWSSGNIRFSGWYPTDS